MRWVCRYSSSEMYCVEVTEKEVRCYLDHSPGRATLLTFEQFLGGSMDYEVKNLFSDAEVAAMKAAVRAKVQGCSPAQPRPCRGVPRSSG